MLKRNPDRCPTHPGAVLREDVVPALNISKVALAKALGVSRQTVYDILGEKQPVTPEMAVRLGKLCGNGAKAWQEMQSAHDLWHAEKAIDVKDIPTLQVA